MIAAIGLRPSTASLTPPAGWTLVRRTDNSGSGSSNSLAVYRKVAGSSEPISYAWQVSGATHTTGGIQAFFNVDTANPIDVEGGQATPLSLSHATPSVTTTVANAMIVTTHTFSTASTWTPPTGMTEAFDTKFSGQSIEGSYVLQPAAGASGAKTATAAGGSGDQDIGNTHIVALRPPTASVSQIYYIHADHLNTPRLVADQAGQTVWRWDQQEPFGVNVPDENPSGLGVFDMPLRYPGQYADKETNLSYNYYRNYDASLGRYVEADPIGLNGGLNLYRYVEANPLANVDPTGLITCLSDPANFSSIGCQRVSKKEEDKDQTSWRQDPPIILITWTVPLPRFGFGLPYTSMRNPVVPSAGRTTEYEEIQFGFFDVQRLYRRNVLVVEEEWICPGTCSPGQSQKVRTTCIGDWTATSLLQRSGFGTRAYRKSLN